MTQADVLERTGIAYLALIHPKRDGGAYGPEILSLVALAPSVPDPVVASLLVGPSWRERLPGLALATARHPRAFVEPVLRSLRDPRGIAIVPACAVLAVLARRCHILLPLYVAEQLDRGAFDGEVGWAVDQAMHWAGLSASGVGGRGPNFGQAFEGHVELYDWIHTEAAATRET